MIDFDTALGIWFYPIPPKGSYLGALTQEDGHLKFYWRIDDGQEKRWYEGTPPLSLPETIEQIRMVIWAAARVAQLNEKPQEILRGNLTQKDWLALLLQQPWTHIITTHPAGHA